MNRKALIRRLNPPGRAEIAGSGVMKMFNNWRAAGYLLPVARNDTGKYRVDGLIKH